MTRKPVKSSNLASVGYDENSHILEIEFHNGGIYQYYAVPIRIHNELMNAESHGKYFAANIRTVYEYRKVG